MLSLFSCGGVSFLFFLSLIRDCVAMARRGQRQTRGGPEAGINEEASAGGEFVQN